MVTDKDIAGEIQKVARGSTWGDLARAWEILRGRLYSRDDDKTVAAFDEVLGRIEAELGVIPCPICGGTGRDCGDDLPPGGAPCDFCAGYGKVTRDEAARAELTDGDTAADRDAAALYDEVRDAIQNDSEILAIGAIRDALAAARAPLEARVKELEDAAGEFVGRAARNNGRANRQF